MNEGSANSPGWRTGEIFMAVKEETKEEFCLVLSTAAYREHHCAVLKANDKALFVTALREVERDIDR